MHIPDGYLSPTTCISLGAVMVPIWATASARVRAKLNSRYIPLMAIGSAFAFTIMMYNVPVPDGTSAHAVGGALLAVVLGPWAASICITIALAIQALFFGDGGIWTFGANCFNMAFLMPFIAYGIYRLIAGKSEVRAKRRWVGAAVGGYVGINFAALAAGVELGLQPLLFHTANGTPLYAPYPLSIAVPAMLFAHLTVAGFVEGTVTALVVRYLQAANPGLLALPKMAPSEVSPPQTGYVKLWWGLAAMVVFVPLGLLAQGTAWGEWGTGEMARLIGFVPSGLARLTRTRPHALFPDYSLPSFDHGFWQASAIYVLCAVVGAALVASVTILLLRMQAAERRISKNESGGRKLDEP